METYGTVDELNSILGSVQSLEPPPSIHARLQRIQNELFEIGADLSFPANEENKLVKRITSEYAQRLEPEIDEMISQIPPLKEFILPGGTQISATLH